MNNPKNKNTPKINRLKPANREKKRYIAYEIISEKALDNDGDNILISNIKGLLGVFLTADAGIIKIKYDSKKQRGVFKVNHKFVDYIRSCFVMIKELNNKKVLIRTLGVSGMVNKAKEYL